MAFGTITALLYYWYFFVHGRLGEAVFWPEEVPIPSKPLPSAGFKVVRVSDDILAAVSTTNNNVLFALDLSQHDAYHVRRDHCITLRDSCYGKPKGSVVPARGLELYEHLRHLVADTHPEREALPVRDDVLLPLGSEKIFYFSCGKGGRIQRVHTCTPGTVFEPNGRCEPMDPCKEGHNTSLPDVFDRHFYYRCDENSNRRVECPNDHFFLYDSCRPLEDFEARCQNQPNGFIAILNPRTFLMCQDTRVVVFQCDKPDELPFLSDDGQVKCVSTVCAGKEKGARVPLDQDSDTHPPFVFTPGYYECGTHGDIKRRVLCPKAWNAYDRLNEEDVTALPTVFDGSDCVPPILCENVDLVDNSFRGEVVVPAHHFQTVAKEWPVGALFDATRGFQCEGPRGTKRIRKTLEAEPGQVVKKFKFALGCSDNVKTLPLANHLTAYFDCDTQQKVDCPEGQAFFGGPACQLMDDGTDVFTLNGVQMFRLKNQRVKKRITLGMSHQTWITPWDYSNEPSPFRPSSAWKPCVAPESVYLNGYNVCAHPDCKDFPYVLWLKGSYAVTRDGSICVRNISDETRLSKLETVYYADGFDFWTQSGTLVPHPKSQGNAPLPKTTAAATPCTFGQKLQTGYLTMDETIHATCDSQMPFVFCPLQNITIERVRDGVYACVPPETHFYLEPNVWRGFVSNELEQVIPLHLDTQIDVDGNGWLNMSAAGIKIKGGEVKLMVSKRVQLEYRNVVTYPPFVRYTSNRNAEIHPHYKEGFNVLARKNNEWTNKPLQFPVYKDEAVAETFKFLA